MTKAMDWPASQHALGAIRERLLALPAGQGAAAAVAVRYQH